MTSDRHEDSTGLSTRHHRGVSLSLSLSLSLARARARQTIRIGRRFPGAAVPGGGEGSAPRSEPKAMEPREVVHARNSAAHTAGRQPTQPRSTVVGEKYQDPTAPFVVTVEILSSVSWPQKKHSTASILSSTIQPRSRPDARAFISKYARSHSAPKPSTNSEAQS